MTAADPSSRPAPPGRPLDGFTVVDFTTFLSGPFCTQILGDLGARIIKIESLEGDSSRSIPPHFVDGDSAYYLGTNRNKLSVALNLKAPDGLSLARRLIAASDVVVENFRPGVCSRLGLDPATIRRKQPALIWASISGFGQTGPWRDRPAYDMIVQALSGVMSLTGEPGRPAARLGIPAGDLVAGMYVVIGVLAAFVERNRTGAGRTIDVSMLDSQLSMLSYQAVYAMLTGEAPQPQAARHDSIVTYRSFIAGDGRELVVTANTERMWREMCEALELPDLPKDPRFHDSGARLKHREALWPVLEQAFLRLPAACWVDRLVGRGVPAASIKTVPEAMQDAREAGRGMRLNLSNTAGEGVAVVGNPIKFEDDAPEGHRYPPRLGQDTARVLQDLLGVSGSELAALQAAGVLAATEPPR